jgi:hypothetical protein
MEVIMNSKILPLPKIPSPKEIEKKLKLSFGLFEAAFTIKRHQLSKKYPQKSDRELNYLISSKTHQLFDSQLLRLRFVDSLKVFCFAYPQRNTLKPS